MQSPATAQDSRPGAASVKAAFLYRFLDYVDWQNAPAHRPDQPVVIGVLASDDMFNEVRRTLAGRSAGTRPLEIRRIAEDESLAGIEIAYVGESNTKSIAQIAKRARTSATLLVTDAEDGLAQGSDINFVTLDGRIRFEVDLNNVQRSSLKLGSGLLSVALRVRGAG